MDNIAALSIMDWFTIVVGTATVIGVIYGIRSYYLSKNDKTVLSASETQSVKQKTKGNQSPAIVSKGSISVTYGQDSND